MTRSIYLKITNSLKLICFAFCLFINSLELAAQNPPLMGWASWNQYGVAINDSIIKAQADAMVSSGLAKVGFQYINIDDGLFNGRYANGALTMRKNSLMV
ncbi:alpha-amylase family protein [Flavobacterium cellulosilyticum]|uniref:Alpha-galactosidase n=1 Tax=Flavobacterium cellulosilyticum TaxID=2541731 RepID=A0A4R5CAP8_9FLAO|nr:hypothetical protein [Flavobacterium cellulosilyticum]TDD97011.1 hypothetical protein E0F76_10255 [Flavobacterium cellulosilyticum]